MTPAADAPVMSATSTQVGAIGELITAAGIMEASHGRLSPFKPLADDDGLDLLVLDKQTRKTVPIQIKCRRGFDNAGAQTVQFDVRLKTFVELADGYVLCIRLEGTTASTFWLIPASELRGVARPGTEKLIVVGSAKAASEDRYSPYRMTSFAEVVSRILERTHA